MPANTPQGFPYPLPSEPVAEGAQAIRNLAEAVDSKLFAKAAVHLTRSTVYNTGSGGSGSAPSYIPFDTARLQTPASPPMWVVGAPSRVTIQAAGVYAAHAAVTFGASATGYRELGIEKNHGGTAAWIANTTRLPAIAPSNIPLLDCLGIASLVAGDYLELVTAHTAGANLDVTATQLYLGLRVWRIA